MQLNLEEIYRVFDKEKEIHDYKEYVDEIYENNQILSICSLEWNRNLQERVQQQISKLTIKYKCELNLLAGIYGNNMTVTNKNIIKTPEILLNDLQYINQHIPLFALERMGISNFLKQKISF